jgi:hypothetical protein
MITIGQDDTKFRQDNTTVQFQDNSTPHLNKAVFRHVEILIRKDGVHVRHIKTSIRHVYTGFGHDNITF